MDDRDAAPLKVPASGPELDAETTARVFQLVRDGLTDAQLASWAETQGLEDVRPFADLARRELARSAELDLTLESGRAVARLHDLYARLHQIGDFKGCLAVQRRLNQVLGLDSPQSSAAVRSAALAVVSIAEPFIPPRKADEFLRRVRAHFQQTGGSDGTR